VYVDRSEKQQHIQQARARPASQLMCCLCTFRRGYSDWGFSVLFPQL